MYYTENSAGDRHPLPPSFEGPLGLPGPDVQGDRAPDSKVVLHTDDGLPVVTTYTITGTVHGVNPTDVMAKLAALHEQIQTAVKLHRFGRHLQVAGGVMPIATLNRSHTAANVTIVFRLSYLSWINEDGVEVAI